MNVWYFAAVHAVYMHITTQTNTHTHTCERGVKRLCL